MILALIAGSVLAARGDDDPDQSEFPQITAQPVDQEVPEGASTTFAVQATNGAIAYQWVRNGVALEGQTNSSLTLDNVGTNDVGLYSCVVSRDMEAVPTRSAILNVSTLAASGQIIVYGTPVANRGSQGACPGAYAGYVNYTKTVSQGWGWAPDTATTIHTARDNTRSDTKVTYYGKNGDTGCGQTAVTVPHPPPSAKYRFAIYFPNNVPTGPYPITLSGFHP